MLLLDFEQAEASKLRNDMRGIIRLWCAMTMALVVSRGAVAGENDVWSVGKSSGEVWIATRDAQQVSLKPDENLKPGDTIRTGRNGRVLLVRGEETILIAPNSVVGLPLEKKDGLSTTILQQAGSILLEVEKRNVKHFEVETPYLAAVVKGTQFSVAVGPTSTRVDVRRGQVEVSDFRSGQIAQVMPGQTATSFAHGKLGLSLTGSGVFSPLEQGRPRASSIERIPVPKGGLTAPHGAPGAKFIHALGPANAVNASRSPTALQHGEAADKTLTKRNAIRISGALGEVRLNVGKATHGLAHGAALSGPRNSLVRNSPTGETVWSDTRTNQNGGLGAGGFGQNNSNSGSGNTAAGAGATTVSGVATAVVTAPAGGNGNGNDNGNGSTATARVMATATATEMAMVAATGMAMATPTATASTDH